MTNNGEGLFGVGAMSSPAMRYGGADGVYKSVNQPDSSPPYHHHQPPSSSTSGIDVPSQAAMHGLNINAVVEGGSDHHQQQPMMMMMMKKKRGRPRKYSGGTDGTMSLALMPATTSPPPPPSQPAASGGPFSSPTSSFKKNRGRPPGSTNKNTNNNNNNINKLHQHIQPPQLGSAGFGFTPHVISVKAGEDVSSKIMSFSQNGPRAVCILSANGAISNVTLRQAATSGGTATYEGRFEILSLCGSFLLTEIAGQRSRTGGLSVSLAGPDGRVLGGCVAGLLTAASPVQVIVGSFIPDGGRKESKVATPNHHTEPTTQISSPPQNPMPMSMQPMVFQGGSGGGGPTAGVSESSHGGSLSDSSGGEGSSPPGHSTGGNHHHNNNNNNNSNNQPQGLMGMPWR